MPQLTIGMPVYNGAEFIERAILSLLGQSFDDFVIVVSDNASTDTTVSIVKRLAEADKRIHLLLQPNNVGAGPNFMLLIEQAKTEYFMWAAADDAWTADYVRNSVSALSTNPEVGFASGRFANVGFDGAVLRQIPSFEALSNKSSTRRIIAYTMLPEAAGKANIIYSVFRTDFLRNICSGANRTFGDWGGDMAVVAAALSRAPYIQDANSTLLKQINSPAEAKTCIDLSENAYTNVEFGGAFPPQLLHQFIGTMTRELASRPQKLLVFALLYWRRFLTLGWQVQQKMRNLRARITRRFNISR